MAICSRCNKEIDGDELFCTECGHLLSDVNITETPATSTNGSTSDATPADDTRAEDLEEIHVTQEDEEEAPETHNTSPKGVLILPDESKIYIDQSQRLVGRADLEQFTESDHNDISRGHFTVFENNGKFYVQDGSTNVQYSESGTHTMINDEDITGNGSIKLEEGDTIKVSDITIHIKVY